MQIKPHEYKFIAWSKSVSSDTYDVAHIIENIKSSGIDAPRVADVGGGIGNVAREIVKSIDGATVDIYDNSELAKSNFLTSDSIRLVFGDFLESKINKQYDTVIFRTVLHHFVGSTKSETYNRQSLAIEKAKSILSETGLIFVTENFYEPFIYKDISGELIYQLTRLKGAAKLFRRLGANTAGEGVRFRSFESWIRMFSANGLRPRDDILRQAWSMPIWQRIPLLVARRYQALLTLEKIQK